SRCIPTQNVLINDTDDLTPLLVLDNRDHPAALSEKSRRLIRRLDGGQQLVGDFAQLPPATTDAGQSALSTAVASSRWIESALGFGQTFVYIWPKIIGQTFRRIV